MRLVTQDLSFAVDTKQEVTTHEEEMPKKYGNRSKDLTGQTFNSLSVIKRVGSKNGKALWLCQCDCGEKTEVITSNLTKGRIKTCGCSRNTDMTGRKFEMITVLERTKIVDGISYWLSECECGEMFELPWSHLRMRKSCGCLAGESHGLRKHPLYRVWYGMKQRCSNPNYDGFKYWGGRGISVCQQWQESFQSFYDWSTENGYEKGLTIDRINVNGNYEPSNCRWATWLEQAHNKQIHVQEETK